jgi:hypothetical protein
MTTWQMTKWAFGLAPPDQHLKYDLGERIIVRTVVYATVFGTVPMALIGLLGLIGVF